MIGKDNDVPRIGILAPLGLILFTAYFLFTFFSIPFLRKHCKHGLDLIGVFASFLPTHLSSKASVLLSLHEIVFFMSCR